MPIEVMVDSLDDVDASLHEEYVQGSDGKFVLKGMAETLKGYVPVEKVTEHESVANLKSALDKERDSAKQLGRRVKELETQSAGLSEEEKGELATLRKAKEDAEESRRRREGEFDTWRDEINGKHADETKGLVAERDGLMAALCEDRISRDIAAGCNEFGGRANILEPLVRRAVKADYEATDDGGRVNISVMDAEGTRLLDNDGKPLTISGFIEKMSQDKEFADLFTSTQKSGGGSSSEGAGDQSDGGAGSEKAPSDLKRSEMSKAEKVKFIRDHSAAEFHALAP